MFFYSKQKLHNSTYWINYVDGFKDMQMSPESKSFLNRAPWNFKHVAKGAGSRVGMWGKLICIVTPLWLSNRLWFLNISRASEIHHVEYDLPSEYKTFTTIIEGEDFKARVDMSFKLNIRHIIGNNLEIPLGFNFIPFGFFLWKSVIKSRYRGADNLYIAAKYEKIKSFWEGKTKPEKWG